MMETINIDQLNEASDQDTIKILSTASELFGPKLSFACSFGLEDMVLVDSIHRQSLDIDIFYLDTGRLHAETYQLIDRVESKYGSSLRPIYPNAEDVSETVKRFGINGFYHSKQARFACCNARKVRPLERALENQSAWITGIRQEQSNNRSDLKVFELDAKNRVKINPLLAWTWEQTWDYIRSNEVPYNQLHEQNYPSIGCQPCTRAISEGEDFRAGRWWWEQNSAKECGLHSRRESL